jgi:hypothetical protein
MICASVNKLLRIRLLLQLVGLMQNKGSIRRGRSLIGIGLPDVDVLVVLPRTGRTQRFSAGATHAATVHGDA